MTLAEERSTVARCISNINEQRSARFAKIMERHPDSFLDQEQRIALVGRLHSDYLLEYNPLWRKLLELCAAEERDGVIYLNPIEQHHLSMANELVASS